MIRGAVNARLEAVFRFRIHGPGGVESDVDAVFDSGFGESLALPTATIAALGLVWHSRVKAMLADGSIQPFDLYEADIEWDGSWRPVLVSALGDEALLGIRLLVGHQLRMDVEPGGVVEIAALP